MKAMILAAGSGTRLKPFTEKHPKALAMVNGKTLLQRNIEYLTSFGISDIIVNICHFPDQIRDFVHKNDSFGCQITFSDESGNVLETGGGLVRASPFLRDSDPFVLMNVDILTDLHLAQMIEVHKKENPIATIAVSERKTSRYFLFNRDNLLCGWENIETGEQKISRQADTFIPKAFSGIHVISPRIFDVIRRQGKFSMVAVYLDLAANDNILGFDHTGSRFIDTGNPEHLAAAGKMFS